MPEIARGPAGSRGTAARRIPISVRLAVVTALSLLALLALVGFVVYHQLGEALRAGLDQQLADTAAALPPGLTQPGLTEDGLDTDVSDLFEDLDVSDPLVQVVDASGAVVLATDDVDSGRPLLPDADLAAARDGDPVLRTAVQVGDDDLVRVLAIPYGDGRAVALVAAELDEVEEAQEALLAVYWPVAVLGTTGAGLLGYLVARRALAPVRRMTEEADAIGGSDLSRRLSLPPRMDEMGRLAATLNGMLERLDAAVLRERAFTADASHELRTPLAILRAEVELARGRVDDPATRANLDSALEESVRLGELVDDLLVLARLEADPRDGRRPVDLDELVGAVLSRFGTLAARRGIALRSTGSAVVRGDPRSLERAIANLVDNAVRHTPKGGWVAVEVTPSASGARIAVRDTGPGVPPAQLPRLFERFTRVDGARHEPGGAGLGLAIVAAVAAAHSGDVAAANDPQGGLRVVLDLSG